MSKTLWGAVAVVGLVLTAAACGGDDAEGSISREDFLEQGNQICRDGNEELDRLAEEEGVDPTDPDQALTFIQEEGIPNVRSQIDDLRDLGYPEGDREELDRIYDDAESLLEELEGADGPEDFDEDPFTDVNERLSSYGLTDC